MTGTKPRTAKRRTSSTASTGSGIGDHEWRLASATILLVAASVRLYHLALAPLHHDEGVNGRFLTALFRSGFYHYDPANYHGPTLYYLSLIVTACNHLLFKEGLSTNAIRFVPAIFGIATVWLILQLRRYLGAPAVLGAAALVAVSPGAVYFSRYFIHEMLFVFFTVGLVLAWLRYHETARPLYLMLASASAAFLFATKETAIISVAILALAYLCTRGYLAFVGRNRNKNRGGDPRGISRRARSEKAVIVESGPEQASATRAGSGGRMVVLLPAAIALFVGIYVLFYASFGSNFPRGVFDSVATFRYWTKTGITDDLHDSVTYLRWLRQEELPSLLLGAVGFAFALYRSRNRFALFCGFWTLGMLLAYSLIPYKTPWLALNISTPLALLAGYGVAEMWNKIRGSKREPGRIFLALALGMALVASAYQAIDLGFRRYDDDSLPYVYAHTRRQFLSLVDKVKEIARINGSGTRTTMTVTSANYWPLPWYLRDYPNVGYWGRVVPTQEAMVIGEASQESLLRALLGDKYVCVGSYDLRPGIVLVLFARRDLAL